MITLFFNKERILIHLIQPAMQTVQGILDVDLFHKMVVKEEL